MQEFLQPSAAEVCYTVTVRLLDDDDDDYIAGHTTLITDMFSFLVKLSFVSTSQLREIIYFDI